MQNIELIVHIGAGKTGSSSIQGALRRNRDLLLDGSIRFLGQVLERTAQPKKYAWQAREEAGRFFRPDDEVERANQVADVLIEEFGAAENAEVTRYIWSHEAIARKGKFLIPALMKVQEQGVRIQIIYYLRRHDEWAKSAYVQWGIKHKGNVGRVRSFKEWMTPGYANHYDHLQTWLEAFPDMVKIRNYSAISDVVSDFSSALDLELKLEGMPRANTSPGNELLAAWAVYNSRADRPRKPHLFQSIAKRANLFANSPDLPPISELLPDAEDLGDVVEAVKQDAEALNKVIGEQGGIPLDFSSSKAIDNSFDQWKMNQVMLRLIFLLYDEVEKLNATADRQRERLNEIQDAANENASP